MTIRQRAINAKSIIPPSEGGRRGRVRSGRRRYRGRVCIRNKAFLCVCIYIYIYIYITIHIYIYTYTHNSLSNSSSPLPLRSPPLQRPGPAR